VFEVRCLEPGFVSAQVRAVIEDIPPDAAKTGALGEPALVEAVAELAAGFGFLLVVDPVMISKHGAPLIAGEARQALLHRLLPHARLVTPNLHEAAALAGIVVDSRDSMIEAARRIQALTGAAVLVKGGHLEGEALDILLEGGVVHDFLAARVETPHTHGTGCTYSAAITAGLALGLTVVEAVARGKGFITRAIATNPGLGGGSGPVNHHAAAE
jgi:hydroxymethylpyrimidine/phosphomethylpyrimidine kinase